MPSIENFLVTILLVGKPADADFLLFFPNPVQGSFYLLKYLALLKVAPSVKRS